MCLPNTNEKRTERKSQIRSTKEFVKYFLKNASKKGAVISKGKREEWKCYQNEKCLSYCIENSSISSTVSTENTVSVDDGDYIDSRPIIIKSCLKKRSKSNNTERSPKSYYQIHLPGQPESHTRSRYISFNYFVKVQTIPSVSELVKYSKQLWFQKCEYKRIRLSTSALISAIKDGKVKKNEYCIRGLERQLNMKENNRKQRLLALHKTLDEHNEQKEFGIYDDIQLSYVYRIANCKFIIEAEKQGALDEATSQLILQRHKVSRVAL
jgi:hypothetical protein